MKYPKSKSDINEADVLQPHNVYTDMRTQYENGLYGVDDDHTGFGLVSVKFIIEGSICEEEACHIEILKK